MRAAPDSERSMLVRLRTGQLRRWAREDRCSSAMSMEELVRETSQVPLSRNDVDVKSPSGDY